MRLKIKKTGSYRYSKKYLKMINDASVYDVSINSPTTHATSLSLKEGNEIYLKREDLQPIFLLRVGEPLTRFPIYQMIKSHVE